MIKFRLVTVALFDLDMSLVSAFPSGVLEPLGSVKHSQEVHDLNFSCLLLLFICGGKQSEVIILIIRFV